MPISLRFFSHWRPNLAQILPQRPHLLSFFADFRWNMFGDSIHININLCCNSAVLKKIGKTSKKWFLGPICTKESHYGPHTKLETIFFGRNNKRRSLIFRNFFFYPNTICFGWVMNLFLSWSWVMFFSQKCVIYS